MKSTYLTVIFILLLHVTWFKEALPQDNNDMWKQKPETVKSLIDLSNSNLVRGKIYLMNSSHQDIAWMDSPEKCVIERDTMLLTPLYNRAILDPSYRFDVEDALMIKEFIQRHPDRKEGITRLLMNGQISCGASYIQPYEEMYSGEALARQFYFGTGWLKQVFNYHANTYWNPDVPGRTLQMPQLLSKAGTKYMLISRFEKGIYRWYAPDNSYVTAYSPGHYAESFEALQKDFYEAADYLARNSMIWNSYFSESSQIAAIPVLSDWDMSPAKDYSNLIRQWNNLSSLPKANGSYTSINLPVIELSLTPTFIKIFESQASNIPSVKGERPAVWLYIHGPSHQKAIRTSREGDILLTVAEKFAVANALINGSYAGYPENELSDAWEAKIFPDHGWGGKHGDITDNYFSGKYIFAKNEAEKIIDRTLAEISSKINIFTDKGIPVTVYNSLSWKRTDVAAFTKGFDRSSARNLVLTDAKGNLIPIQLSHPTYYEDGSIKSVNIHFIATDVASVGYKTYYLKTAPAINRTNTPDFYPYFENNFYRIGFTDGGLSEIFDKELNLPVVNTKEMKAGEVFTLHSEGNGAGEFADIQQPDMKGYDRAANYKANWRIDEDGDVYSAFINRQPIRNAVVEERIVIYKDIKRIDFEIALLNYEGVLYREYRMALPVNMKNGQVSYEVPFGVVNVGKDEMGGAAGERYIIPCKDVHPRGIENFIGISNREFGITLSSTVAVADYINPNGLTSDNQILQPILLASRKSCHGEGNEYLQTGDHYFSFSLFSHKPGWENGFRSGRQANEKLIVVTGYQSFKTASLPEEMSFFNLGSDNVVISAIKKAENDNALVFRVYELFGKPAEATITCFKPFKQASKTNLIEEIISPVRVTNGYINCHIDPYSIETYIAQ
jgi:alpha-mannosidase